MGEYTSKFPNIGGGIFLLGYFGKIFVTFPTCCSGKSAAYKTNSWLSECLRRKSFFLENHQPRALKILPPTRAPNYLGRVFGSPKWGVGKVSDCMEVYSPLPEIL